MSRPARSGRIMHAYLSPQSALDVIEGRGSDYWETRPGETGDA
jgi:hypothetical protein